METSKAIARTISKPQPRRELFVELRPNGNRGTIALAAGSERALAWINKQAPEYGEYYPPKSKGDTALLIVSALYEPCEVEAWLRDGYEAQPEETAPEPGAAPPHAVISAMQAAIVAGIHPYNSGEMIAFIRASHGTEGEPTIWLLNNIYHYDEAARIAERGIGY